MKNNKYLEKLILFINTKSNFGKELISIKQQKKGSKTKFYIHPVYKNKLLTTINVEYNTLPLDTQLPLELFKIVIDQLLKAEDLTLSKGVARKKDTKIGDKGLESENTLESIIAIKYYKIFKGSLYSRISPISNILVEANICQNLRSGSKLKLIKF